MPKNKRGLTPIVRAVFLTKGDIGDGISRNSGDINKINDPKGFIQDLLESLRRQ